MKATRLMTNVFANALAINHRMTPGGLLHCINHSNGSGFAENPENKLQQISRQQQMLSECQRSLAHSVAAFNGRYITLPGPVQNNLLQRWRNDCPYGWQMAAKTHLIAGNSKITKVCFNTEEKRTGENLWHHLESKIYPTVINNPGLSDFFYKHSVIPSDYYPQWSRIPAQEDVVALEVCGAAPETRSSMVAELSSLIGHPVYRLSQIQKDSNEASQHGPEMVRNLLKRVNDDDFPHAIVGIDMDQPKEGVPACDLLPEIKKQFARCGQKAIVLLMSSDKANISTFAHGSYRYHIEPPEEIRQLTGKQEVLSELLAKHNQLSRGIPVDAQAGLQRRLLSELPHGWRIRTIVQARKFQITDLTFDVNTRVFDYLRHTIRHYVSENQIPTTRDIDWHTTEEMLAGKIPWELTGEAESDKCTEVVKDYLAKLSHYCADQGLSEVTQDAVDECSLNSYLDTQA